MSRIKTKKITTTTDPPCAPPDNTTYYSNYFKSLNTKVNTTVSLADKKLKGTKKTTPGRVYKGTTEFLSPDNAEYLYLTNGYIARGLDTESDAIVRNGFSIKPNKSSDQKAIDEILRINDFALICRDVNRFMGLYRQPMMEMYVDPETKIWKFVLLPPTEMDYQRDKSNKIVYDKDTGEPAGYVQKRDGKEIAVWTGDDAKRIVVFKDRTLGGYTEGIPGIQTILYAATEYGHIRASISDSFIRSLPVTHVVVDGMSLDDAAEATAAFGQKFTARSTYVTSERFSMNNTCPSNDIDVFKFIEPTLSEIAACFHMPIEMLGATQYLKGDDFNDRYAEWIEHIKMKQKLIASIFERKVFNVLFPDGVTVKFNNPATLDTNDLIKNTAYAMQAGAIDSDMALEILVKNNVFGAFTDEMLSVRKSKGDTKNGMQKEKEEVTEEE